MSTTRKGMGAPPVVLLLFMLIPAYGIYLEMSSTMPGRTIWPQLVIIAILALSVVTYRRRIPEVERDALVQELLTERRCASCAYDLTSTAAQTDGRTVCPECGAAWIVPSALDLAP